MGNQSDIDFKIIVPRLGSQRDSFEELCCQLAHQTIQGDTSYIRLHGAGGDGGVECFVNLPDGSRTGWQAKYIFEIDSLLTQVTNSLTTALKINSTLTRYVVCFPFDLTGPTGRRGRSSQEKFDEWRAAQERNARAEGRQLTIEAWSASSLRELLLQHDASGGIREFFFNQNILTYEWFSQHLELAKKTAGPRYNPELNVKTDLWRWFAAFGRTALWTEEFKERLRSCRKAYKDFASALCRTKPDAMAPVWPEGLREEAQKLVEHISVGLSKYDALVTIDDPDEYGESVSQLDGILTDLASLELKLVEDFEAKHGKGKANSPGFRQFMAEYMCSFPASNLDHARDLIDTLRGLNYWLCSPACMLAYKRVFVLSGIAGSGKTHGICDIIYDRFHNGLLSCVTFGHEFRGDPDPWTRLTETLSLPITLGMNGVLDALNAAGEASGSPLILYMDAINETRPLRYWRDRLATFSQAVQRRQHLRLCITCRTSFLPYCLPTSYTPPIIEHKGFTGIERDACQAFFHYYGLEPPIAPILNPELSNPLYLRLVCETLRARGLSRLPLGWHGLAQTIRSFLSEKERQFATEYETNPGANIVAGSLMAISRTIAESGNAALPWSQAQRVILTSRPQAHNLPVLEWLVRADLLLEDAPIVSATFDGESIVRPAFERLGDFLIASELMDRCQYTEVEKACKAGGVLHTLLKDSTVMEQNNGVIAALSILIPEHNHGYELPNLVDNEAFRPSLLRITVKAFPSRDPETFSPASAFLIREGLGWSDFSFEAMDMILSISWQPSAIDGFWLDELLKQRRMAERDAYWCAYIHDRYESNSTVYRLINAAFELPLERLDDEIAERWATVLLWFTAAADRRVKDWATRAATAIMTATPRTLPNLLHRFIHSDDDEIRERALLACYGALILSRDFDVLTRVTGMLQSAYRREPEAFDNALIRDHIRCITELAAKLNVLPEGCDPELTMQPIDSDWPPELPSEDHIKAWGKLLHFKPDEFLSDFFKYSMNCLGPWNHAFPKKNMGEWILQRAARDFHYEGSGCKEYDGYMLGKHGGGRGKPTWAERIGKKYQWIAMYQLASRLHDHIERKQDSWEPQPLRTPLILAEERKLDPTLPPTIPDRKRETGAWWIRAAADLGAPDTISDEGWVGKQEDLPELERLLSPIEHDGQNWRLLVSYPAWGHRNEDADWNEPYRHVWMHINSYLVQKQDFDIACDCLYRRNFFGGWMPEAASWLYGFAGEYPWATPFNTEPETWHGQGGHGTSLPVFYNSSWNQLAVEWEYDTSVPGNFHMTVPARTFFSLGDLWWDGKDGYKLVNGRTVFRDPSVMEEGPASLLVDITDFGDRLNRLGLRLVWTVLGEKWILGGRHDQQTPRRTFSQIARLNEDSSVSIGERVFFDDYDKDTGPISVRKKKKRKIVVKRAGKC